MVHGLKPASFIPPVVALAISGILIGSQRQSISVLEKESLSLQRHIAAVRAPDSDKDTSRGKSVPLSKSAKSKEAMDWKKIAAEMAEMQRSGGMGDMRTMIRLQQRLQSMSKEDLVAALDEIAALDLPEDSRNMLEQMLVGPLIQKDPEFALTRFADRLDDGRSGVSWQLANAMQEWSKKDPARAVAWFDQQIAAGKFESKSLDGRSHTRSQFEGSLIGVLLGSDPDAASARLAALPENQRGDVLSNYSFQNLKEEDQLAFAKLVRGQIPAKDQARTIGQQAARLVGEDGYEKVTGFLNRIGATPAERIASVEQAAQSKIQTISYQKKVTASDLDAMREWATSEAPDSVDRITGNALASTAQNGNKMKFTDAADLAVKYHEASGNDEVLSNFLGGWAARQNKEQSRLLAEKISDGKRREEVLKTLK